MSWENVLLVVAAGAGAGAAGRVLLGRLRRGVRVPAGPMEAASGALLAVVVWEMRAGDMPSWWVPVPVLLSLAAVPLATVDLTRLRLPDVLTVPAGVALVTAVTAAAVLAGRPELAVGGILGGTGFFVAHLLVHLLRPGALGAGDVKLAAALGVPLGAMGWAALVLAACLAAAVTLGLAIVGALSRVRAWRAGVPHGPGMLAAAWLLTLLPGSGMGVGH